MKKSNLVKLGLTALMASMFSTSGNADVIPGNATANVIAPLILVETLVMDFGDVAGGTATGTVTLPIIGGPRVVTGDASALASAVGNLGGFTIEGAAGLAFTLAVTGPATLGDGAGNFMTVDTFTENGNAVTLSGPGIPDAFSIGGRLNLGASQVPNPYTTVGFTPFTVTANYN